MIRNVTPKRIGAVARDGRAVWLTADDRWSIDPAEAELIDDEAHGDIRLLFAERSGEPVSGVRLIDVAESVNARARGPFADQRSRRFG